MKIVIAPDSYKGSLSARDVAQAMSRGARAIFPQAEVIEVPIADGGEGTVEALVYASGGHLEEATVRGPLAQPVRATWGILGSGDTAVIEVAAASGLTLVPLDRRDPRLTSTYGTGELVRAALAQGLRKLVIGLGGSATNDGGAGMARALGVRFLDASGADLPDGGAALANLDRIDTTGLDPRLAAADIVAACDVDNPLTGPRGAAAVYGPQKGATPDMVQELDGALLRYAGIAARATGRDVASLPGAGAAGGLGAGLLFFTPARLRPGVDIVLDAVRFQEILRDADFVITGEGRTDLQTAMGKAPIGVAAVAKRQGIPVVCLSGALGEGADHVLRAGIDAIASAAPGPMTLEQAMQRGAPLIEAATARVCRLLGAGMTIATRSRARIPPNTEGCA